VINQLFEAQKCSPFPAEKVSTVKFAGAPTIGPKGSIPGP